MASGALSLGTGKYQQTLTLYHEQFADPARSSPNFVDSVSLLWRLNLTGQPTPQEWQALTPSLEALRHMRTYLFNQMHVALGLTGARRLDWATAYLDGLRARVKPEQPGLLGEVGVPLVEGLIAYANGAYARTVACLQPIQARIIDIGGSHAQREIFSDILLDAALQTGAYDVASALLDTKRRHRPDRPWPSLLSRNSLRRRGRAHKPRLQGLPLGVSGRRWERIRTC